MTKHTVSAAAIGLPRRQMLIGAVALSILPAAAGASPSPDAAIFAAWDAYQSEVRRANSNPAFTPEQENANGAAIDAIDAQIEELDAKTVAGFAVKLRHALEKHAGFLPVIDAAFSGNLTEYPPFGLADDKFALWDLTRNAINLAARSAS